MGLPEPVFVNVQGAQESIPPSYVAMRAGKTNKVILPGHQYRNFTQSVGVRNRMATRPGIPGLLKSLKIPSQTTKVAKSILWNR